MSRIEDVGELEYTLKDLKNDIIYNELLNEKGDEKQKHFMKSLRKKMDAILDRFMIGLEEKPDVSCNSETSESLTGTLLKNIDSFFEFKFALENKIKSLSLMNTSPESKIIKDIEFNLLQKWISTDTSEFELLYRGTRDGFQASKFHEKCDKAKPTITIIKSNHGKIFGGYNDLTWKQEQGTGHHKQAKAFLFSITDKEKYPAKSGESNTVYCNSGCLPCFGKDELHLNNNCDTVSTNAASFGFNFERKGKYGDQFVGGNSFTVKDIEIFQVKYTGKFRNE